MDDLEDLQRIFDQYHRDDKQVRGRCSYFIGESHLFRVQHVLSYLEANRQVIDRTSPQQSPSLFFLGVVSRLITSQGRYHFQRSNGTDSRNVHSLH